MKKQLFLALTCLIPLQNYAAEIAGALGVGYAIPVVRDSATYCFTECFVPCLKSFAEGANDILEKNFPPQNESLVTLQKIVPDEKIRKLIIDNAPNYYGVSYRKLDMPPPKKEKFSPSTFLSRITDFRSVKLFQLKENKAKKQKDLFFQEQKVLENMDIIDLNLGENFHALVFKSDRKDILSVEKAPKIINEHVFDDLFPTTGLSESQTKEKRSMQKLAYLLNSVFKNQPSRYSFLNYPHGLYISTSGRKFYKFGKTYILPLRSDEINPHFELKSLDSLLDCSDPSSEEDDDSCSTISTSSSNLSEHEAKSCGLFCIWKM